MSQRINSCLYKAAIVLRPPTTTGILEIRRTSGITAKCLRILFASRSVSQRVKPRRSSIQLDKNIFASLTRALRKYLAAGKDFTSILKSNPTQGNFNAHSKTAFFHEVNLIIIFYRWHFEGCSILEIYFQSFCQIASRFPIFCRALWFASWDTSVTKDGYPNRGWPTIGSLIIGDIKSIHAEL